MTGHLNPGNLNLDDSMLVQLAPSLFERSIIDIHLVDQFWQHALQAIVDIIFRFLDAWDWVIEFKLFAFCLALTAGLFAGGTCFVSGRRLVRRLIETRARLSRLHMAHLVFIEALVPTVSLFPAFMVAGFFFHYSQMTSPASLIFYHHIMVAGIMASLLLAGSRALLSPRLGVPSLLDEIYPDMRRHSVRRLVGALMVVILVVKGDDIIEAALLLVNAPTTLMTTLHLVFMLLLVPIVWCLLPKRQELRFVRPGCWLILGLSLICALAGYVTLGRFIIKFSVTVLSFLPLISIGLLISQALMKEGGFASSTSGRYLIHILSLSPVRLDQIGLVAGLCNAFLLLCLAIVPIFFLCGFSALSVGLGLLHLFIGVQIGPVFISPLSLLIGLVFFLVSFLFCRWLIKMLDGTVLAHGHIDVGARHSIRVVSGYAALALSVIIGISAAGINLSSLGLIAGGLSLGIGFGMQNIVQNFVAGLILLVTRPFKVGDFIETGSVTGVVRRISVRATEIETLQHRAVTIPNSTFINSNVSNWTPHGTSGQIDMSFSLPADCPPAQTIERLLCLARNIPQVLPHPAPAGELIAFNDKSLTIALYVHIADIKATHKVKTSLNLAVYEQFFHKESVEDPVLPIKDQPE